MDTCSIIPPEDKDSVFTTFLYTHATKEFIDWRRRRITDVYSSVTTALSIIIAIIIVYLINSITIYISIGSILINIILISKSGLELSWRRSVRSLAR
jgi:hypothetical protein